ncbi:MAG: Flp family type IVb pilin [Stenotrophobium sp.]
MLKAIKQFIRDEEGATAIEYGLIIGLIAVVLVAILLLIGPNLNNLFTKVNTGLTTANGGG